MLAIFLVKLSACRPRLEVLQTVTAQALLSCGRSLVLMMFAEDSKLWQQLVEEGNFGAISLVRATLIAYGSSQMCLCVSS